MDAYGNSEAAWSAHDPTAVCGPEGKPERVAVPMPVVREQRVAAKAVPEDATVDWRSYERLETPRRWRCA